MSEKRSLFTCFAQRTATLSGKPATFMSALAVVIIWATLGPVFDYSDTWQLVINTSTTIITFLMVFLIQNTQNRDTAAMQIKLDELIRSIDEAHDALLDLEELEDKDIDRIRKKYRDLAQKAREAMRAGNGRGDKGILDIDSLD